MIIPFGDAADLDRSAHVRESIVVEDLPAVAVCAGMVAVSAGRATRIVPDALRSMDADGRVTRFYAGRLAGEDLAVVSLPPESQAPADGSWVHLRELAGALTVEGPSAQGEIELAMTAVALSGWHAANPRCASCGLPTSVLQAGWLRRCDGCGRDHFPRTDPAVIVAITDADDRLLLAHATGWSAGRFSHLAGFLEPGESLEQAVHREVFEESGLRIANLRYVGSQPWPFPASLMVGFTASAVTTEVTLDMNEVSEAMWVTRAELAARVAEGSILPAPHGSIARRMLEEWFGGPVDGPAS